MEVASSNPVQFFFQLILRSSSTSRACRSPPTSRRPRPGLRLPAVSEAAKCPTPATLTAEAELSSNRFESCPFESGTRMKTGSNRDQNRIKSYGDFFQTEIDLKCCCLVSSLKSNYFLKSFVKTGAEAVKKLNASIKRRLELSVPLLPPRHPGPRSQALGSAHIPVDTFPFLENKLKLNPT